MATKELRERICLFFQTQPHGKPAGLDTLAMDLREDELKKLVSDDDALAAAKDAEAKKKTVPTDKNERKEYGRKEVVGNVIEEMKKDGTIKACKMDEGGLGYIWPGEYKEDKPEGQTPKIKKIQIDQIRIDPKLQQRADGIDEATVKQYSERADQLPPVRVFSFREDGKQVYLLSRGFHRVPAFKMAGWDVIPCEVFDGDREDALLDAVGDNATHGRRRTMKDIEKAVGTLLNHKNYKNASTSVIATQVQIAWATAAKLIAKIRQLTGQAKPEVVVGKGGKKHKAKKVKKKATTAAPPAETKTEVEPPKSTGVKDSLDQEVPVELVPAFTDNRLIDSCNNIGRQLAYLRDLRVDGTPITSIPQKERDKLIEQMEYTVQTILASIPYAIIPEGWKVDTAIARRQWMNEAEYKVAKKANSGKKSKSTSQDEKKEETLFDTANTGAENGEPATVE